MILSAIDGIPNISNHIYASCFSGDMRIEPFKNYLHYKYTHIRDSSNNQHDY